MSPTRPIIPPMILFQVLHMCTVCRPEPRFSVDQHSPEALIINFGETFCEIQIVVTS